MNSFDFLLAFGFIDQEVVQNAIEYMQPGKSSICKNRNTRAGEGTVKYRHKRFGKTLLIAAVIVALFAAMCAAAYALNLFGLKDAIIGDRVPDGVFVGDDYVKVAVPAVTVSLQGFSESPEFMAAKEFNDFYNDYIAGNYYGDTVPQPQDEWMQTHRMYLGYTTTLKEKILALCDSYSLKTRDGIFEGNTLADFRAYTGLDGFLPEQSGDSPMQFTAFDDGSFRTDYYYHGISLWLKRNMKGWFSTNYISFDADERISEEQYTTARGDAVLIIMGENSCAIMYDGADAVVTAIANGVEDKQEHGMAVTADELKIAADSIDFAYLGLASAVNAEYQPAATPTPPVDIDAINSSTVGIGDSFYSIGQMDKIEITVTGMTLSDNAFDAGWQLKNFDEYSYAIAYDSTGALEAFSYPDYIDQSTGALINGVRLLTVELEVSNHNAESRDIGAGTNVFPYCLLSGAAAHPPHPLTAPASCRGSSTTAGRAGTSADKALGACSTPVPLSAQPRQNPATSYSLREPTIPPAHPT